MHPISCSSSNLYSRRESHETQRKEEMETRSLFRQPPSLPSLELEGFLSWEAVEVRHQDVPHGSSETKKGRKNDSKKGGSESRGEEFETEPSRAESRTLHITQCTFSLSR